MAGKKKPQKTKRPKNRVIPFCAALCFLLVLTFGERWLTAARVCADIRDAEAALIEVNTERLELEEELSLLENEEYLAAMAREKLGYIYPEEEIWLEAEVNPDVLTKGAAEEEIIAD